MKVWLFGKNKWHDTLTISIAIITLSIFTYSFSIAHSQTACPDVDNGFTGSGYGVIDHEVTLSPLTGIAPGCTLTAFTFNISFPTHDPQPIVAVVYSDDGSGNPKNLLFQGTNHIDTTTAGDVLVPIPGGVTVDSTGRLWVGLWSDSSTGTPVITAGPTPDGSTAFFVSSPPNPWSGTTHQAFHAIGHFGSTTVDDTDPASLGPISAPVSPIQVNTQFTASDTFTDDSDDTHTASWDWGDSTTSTGTVTESGGSGSVQDTHTYTTPGVYTLTLTVNNSDGTTATKQFQYVVAYDPNGAFVTGSGWINSPPGAYYANPSLTGKATFGFNSKYQNGANVPTGNTEFNFKVANLNFHSTSYDWLVVAGAKAQFKGTGTINGAGSYKFMLTAIDGAINGGGGIDKFRIKITDSNNGLVYDNLLNAPDSVDPTAVLGGGNIIIHHSS